MATTPIVTEVTKAQLDALVAANGLNEGLQYKVTDKDWLLIATSSNKLKPLTGVMTIINGTDITGIEPDILNVDTGVITTDIYLETGTPVIINFPVGYYPVFLALDVISQNDVLNAISCPPFILLDNDLVEGYKVGLYPLSVLGVNVSLIDSITAFSACGNGNGNTLRAVIQYKKSEI